MHSLTTTTSLPIFTGWPQSSIAWLDYNGIYTVNLPLCQVAITVPSIVHVLVARTTQQRLHQLHWFLALLNCWLFNVLVYLFINTIEIDSHIWVIWRRDIAKKFESFLWHITRLRYSKQVLYASKICLFMWCHYKLFLTFNWLVIKSLVTCGPK